MKKKLELSNVISESPREQTGVGIGAHGACVQDPIDRRVAREAAGEAVQTIEIDPLETVRVVALQLDHNGVVLGSGDPVRTISTGREIPYAIFRLSA